MQLFAIFGNPVHHSKSPLMHNLAFRTLGYPGCYVRWRLETGEKLRDTFFQLGLHGANITVPHKEWAFKAADIVEDFAREVEAVNTLVLQEGKLYGYNTDAPGFYRALGKLGSFNSALIIGAGGTARALALYLRRQGMAVHILNRSPGRLAWFEKSGFSVYTWENFRPDRYGVVINTTSAGLGDDRLPLPANLLRPTLAHAQAAVEVIYGKITHRCFP